MITHFLDSSNQVQINLNGADLENFDYYLISKNRTFVIYNFQKSDWSYEFKLKPQFIDEGNSIKLKFLGMARGDHAIVEIQVKDSQSGNLIETLEIGFVYHEIELTSEKYELVESVSSVILQPPPPKNNFSFTKIDFEKALETDFIMGIGLILLITLIVYMKYNQILDKIIKHEEA